MPIGGRGSGQRAPLTTPGVREADERAEHGTSDHAPPSDDRQPRARIGELDAVRGLAALTVVAGHSLTVFFNFDAQTRDVDGLELVNALKYTPLALVQSGDAAVILFFILSGFVLSLPFLGRRSRSYAGFVAKRVCRIYLPYLAAVALAIACAAVLGGERIPELSQWVNDRWQGDFGAGLLIGHATLVGSFDNAQFDPVLWSLVHEMRISLILPLLVMAVVWLGFARSVAAAIGVLFAGLVLNKVGVRLGHQSDYFVTLYYVPCFVAGILLARHRHTVVSWFARLTPGAKAALLLGGVLLYTYPSWMSPEWFSEAHVHHLDVVAVTLGGCVFMIWALGSPRVSRYLRGRVPQFLGRISYSLYLLHAVVLLTLLHMLHGTLPTAGIVGVMWIVTLPLAALAHRWIELPAIALGKHLATGFDERRRAAGAKEAEPMMVRTG